MREPEAGRGDRGQKEADSGPRIFVAPVVMLRPIRTLVIARDLGFRQRAMTVLVALGPVSFAVVAPDEVVALVERQRPDVVVLDATGAAAAIGETVAALHEVNPHLGVVVVSDESGRTRSLPALPKWGWAADLARAVQVAYRHGNPYKEDLSDARIQ